MHPSLRERARTLIETTGFERAVTALIVLNAFTLGLETSERVMAAAGPFLIGLDRAILAAFVAELLLRLYVRRLAFFRDPWRVFDLIVVGFALVPATGNLSVLRAFRILRVLRLIGSVPSMRRVVAGLLSAIPGMGSIVLLLTLIFYVFAVMATKLFGEAFPEWFGTLGESAYSLFQIMTLESWSMGIVRPVMEAFPYAWAFFVPFIVITSFAVLNLFVGIIVDAMQSQHQSDAHDEREAMMNDMGAVLAEVRALRTEMASLQSQLRQGQMVSAPSQGTNPD
ncbi:ion transporter [Jiella mangrovi]|uniref:Ion transporter n=1 Tax=Jiella mangrovi TaxID=2821407 RepID=A0ABS4BI08_9HYPH|nr:ion transporter [Jiella mangrovi]MBP0616389.1 ion transporter [Jiella mangrovi]